MRRYDWLRLVLVLLLAEAVHAVFVVEQPEGSGDVLPFHERMDWLCNTCLYAPIQLNLFLELLPRCGGSPFGCYFMEPRARKGR